MNKQLFCKLLLAFTDFISLFFTFFIAISMFKFSGGYEIELYMPTEQFEQQILIHFMLSSICVSWFWLRLRHYTYRKTFWFELKEVIRTLAIILLVEVSILALSKLYISRYLWGVTWGLIFLFVPLGRIFVKNLLIKTGLYLKKTVIIGGGENAIDAYKSLMSESYLGLEITCFVSDAPINSLCSLNVPIIKAQEVKEFEANTQFIIALEDDESKLRDDWLRYLSKHNYRSISVIPTLRGLPLYGTDISFLFSYEVILLRVNNNLAKRSSKAIKRIFDILISLCLLIMLSPIFLWIYLNVKKDGGSATYSQIRIGQNGKAFHCYKFRSMVMNSAEVLNKLLQNDQDAKQEWERTFKLKNDPRITQIGHFLRRTSLDELPQLWNVLKGDMSLVGPRPIVRQELKFYKNDLIYYYMVRPGLSGLWQVSGRSDIDYEKRVYFDAWYVKNWSFWNDLVILLKTAKVVFKGKGAY